MPCRTHSVKNSFTDGSRLRAEKLDWRGEQIKLAGTFGEASVRTNQVTHVELNGYRRIWLGDLAAPYLNIVRAMPNTPALIRAGITGLYAAPGVTAEGRRIAGSLLDAVGKTVWFDDEAMLDAVTAVSGSGPAYVFYFIEALEQAALELGFDREAASLFARQTFLGGAQLATSTDEAPGVLRARVTSKRGTTESAIEVFDRHALKNAFIDGVKAACARSRELGRELGAAPIDSARGAV